MNENNVESAAEIVCRAAGGGGGGGGGGEGGEEEEEEDIILDTSCNRLVECSVGGGWCYVHYVMCPTCVCRVLVVIGEEGEGGKGNREEGEGNAVAL